MAESVLCPGMPFSGVMCGYERYMNRLSGCILFPDNIKSCREDSFEFTQYIGLALKERYKIESASYIVIVGEHVHSGKKLVIIDKRSDNYE